MSRYDGWHYGDEVETISPVNMPSGRLLHHDDTSPISPMVLSSIPAPYALGGHRYPQPARRSPPQAQMPPPGQYASRGPRQYHPHNDDGSYYYANPLPPSHIPPFKAPQGRLHLNTTTMTSQKPPRTPPQHQFPDMSSYQHRQQYPRPFPPHPPPMNHYQPNVRASPAGPAPYGRYDQSYAPRPGTSPVSANERRWNGPMQPNGNRRPPHDYSPPTRAEIPRQIRKAPSVPEHMARQAPAIYNNDIPAYPDSNVSVHKGYLDLVQPEQYLYPEESSSESRGSYHSTGTHSPSNIDTSTTERSSLLTKASSVSDHGYQPAFGKTLGHKRSISVEEYIALYEDGFEEDPSEPELPPTPAPPAKEYNYADLGKVVPPKKPVADLDRSLPPTPPTEFPTTAPPIQSSPPRAIAKDKLLPSPASRPSSGNGSREQSMQWKQLPVSPGLMLRKPEARDRYGFKKKTQNVSEADYDAWNSSYTGYLERRRKKWESLMNGQKLTTVDPIKFPPRSDKVKRYIRKGIPPDWRGAAWFWYAGGTERLAKNPHLYPTLLQRVRGGALSDQDREHIERDLQRTFPDNKRFKPDQSTAMPSNIMPGQANDVEQETSIIQALRRVLQAFAINNPGIGYCQSLNFLAGLLLLFLDEDEAKAFTMLSIITSEHLPGTHGVVLANADVAVLMTYIRESMPAVWSKINDLPTNTDLNSTTRLPTVSLATTSWFMSCFIGTLPIESVLRVWDVLFYEGSKTLFRVALAVFKMGERSVRGVADPLEIFQVVQGLPRGLVDASALMGTCFKRRGGIASVTQQSVDARRAERKRLAAEEKARGGKG